MMWWIIITTPIILVLCWYEAYKKNCFTSFLTGVSSPLLSYLLLWVIPFVIVAGILLGVAWLLFLGFGVVLNLLGVKQDERTTD